VALYDSADIIRRAKLRLNRPAVDEALGDPDYYDFATEAQDDITKDLAVFVPTALWTVPTLLTTADGGYTYGFGVDTDGAAIFALGKFRLYADKAAIPDLPLQETVDYTVEGPVVRMPNNSIRSFADGGPYTQYVAPSNVLSASVQPTVPKIARLALIAKTAAKAASRVRATDLAAEQEADYQTEWLKVVAAVRSQTFGKSGTPDPSRTGRRYRGWWRGPLSWTP
jgi:hypothetical protein